MDNVFFSTEPKFQNWSREDYIKAGVKYIVPMTAKAIEDEETQNILLNDPEVREAVEKIILSEYGTLDKYLRGEM